MSTAERVKIALADGAFVTTKELVVRLGDPPVPNLTKLATTSLASFARRGPAETRVLYGKSKLVRPWVWHDYGSPNDEAKTVCPKCGRKL